MSCTIYSAPSGAISLPAPRAFRGLGRRHIGVPICKAVRRCPPPLPDRPVRSADRYQVTTQVLQPSGGREWWTGAALVPTAAALLMLASPPQLSTSSHKLSGTPSAAQLVPPVSQQAPLSNPGGGLLVLTGTLIAPEVSAPASATEAAALEVVQEQQEQPADVPARTLPDGSHRPFVLDTQTGSALALCMVVAALANSAGIGGGAFIVPLMYLGLQFDIKDSTALSQAVIAGGALGSVVWGVQQQHPQDCSKPLIDYSLALVITPMLLLGCTTGVLFNQLLPNWGVTLLLIPLLVYLTQRTGSTALRLYRAESAAATVRKWAPEQLLEGQQQGQLATAVEGRQAQQGQQGQQGQQALGEGKEQEEQQGCPIPWAKALELMLLWTVLLGLQVVKHSFNRCTWQFGLLYGGQATAAVAASAFFIWQAVRSQQEERAAVASTQVEQLEPQLPSAAPLALPGSDSTAAAAPGHEGGVPCITEPAADASSWGTKRLATSAGVAFGGGAVAGMLGIGGGMVVGPLMLELGVAPQVSSATASAMVLFSASSATGAFALENRLNLEYAAVYGAACAVAAYVGVELVGRAVRRSGRASLVVILLAGIVGTGALLTVVFSGGDAVRELMAGQAAGLGTFCATR